MKSQIRTLTLRPLTAGMIALLLLVAGWASGTARNDDEFFAKSGSKYGKIIQASEQAFMAREVEGAIANLDDDYVLYDIKEEGAIARLRGKETVRQALGMIFQSDVWIESDVTRLALVDNTLVQIEHDTFKTDDGTKTVSTLVVFEHRNGKRWREWRFIPADR
ncbi:MAG TPA: hypothetical protein QF499_09995 [Gammaproteobacteria bacterium]|nr:hypothetical protein [Gammaproteobacteria bacterium]MDP7661436.1 hypothetical protein [Gammaproteobacteria bacterium]HJP39443.1 hypothetical protein [Gammaproteobacteria bacterium]